MKKLLFLVPLLFVVALSFGGCGNSSENYEIKECALTTFTSQDLDGNIINQSVYADSKVTMINVWGDYCEPCMVEIPALNELSLEYSDADFQIIGIPVDGSRASSPDARAILEELGATYTNIKVSNSVKPFVGGIASVPYTIFVNAEGKQIGKAYAGSKSKKEWKKIINGLLDFINFNS